MANSDKRLGMRAAAREKIFEPASLSLGTESMRVHMLDVSIGGAKLHCPAPLAIGASVVLAWAEEERVAHVAWIAGARCGLRFRIPLAADQIETLTRPALPRHRPGATIAQTPCRPSPTTLPTAIIVRAT